MRRERWIAVGAAALFFALLVALSLRARPGGRAFKALEKGARGLAIILIGSVAPFLGVGINALTALLLAFLGAPGLLLARAALFL